MVRLVDMVSKVHGDTGSFTESMHTGSYTDSMTKYAFIFIFCFVVISYKLQATRYTLHKTSC